MLTETPLWAVAPFPFYLLCIAILPLAAGRLWEHNRYKLLLAVAISAPTLLYLLHIRHSGGALLVESAREYLSFIALLAALFVISGGVYVRGTPAGTPWVNVTFLGLGALLASLLGTTGASALLVRPLLRANQNRKHAKHIFVFFIFIVSNGAGLLTPLGDPPLFLGFLRGVPFSWTLRLTAPWALVNGLLLLLFLLFDHYFWTREPPRTTQAHVEAARERLQIVGSINFIWLLGVVVTIFELGSGAVAFLEGQNARFAAQLIALCALLAASLLTTPAGVHEANRFSWAPIQEVAVIFVGVFTTMIPALCYLEERGAALGLTQPWQFFWASGVLSSVLDNAPTYLTFASLAAGVVDAGTGTLSAANLGALAAHPAGGQLLAAVSCGSVLMGAITYIGNGPNFMVKAIAEQHHVRMPSFFGYTLWSGLILVPLFVGVAFTFF